MQFHMRPWSSTGLVVLCASLAAASDTFHFSVERVAALHSVHGRVAVCLGSDAEMAAAVADCLGGAPVVLTEDTANPYVTLESHLQAAWGDGVERSASGRCWVLSEDCGCPDDELKVCSGWIATGLGCEAYQRVLDGSFGASCAETQRRRRHGAWRGAARGVAVARAADADAPLSRIYADRVIMDAAGLLRRSDRVGEADATEAAGVPLMLSARDTTPLGGALVRGDRMATV